jgi:hypothetical protein
MTRRFNCVKCSRSSSYDFGLLLAAISFLAAASAFAVSGRLPMEEFMLDTNVQGAPAGNRQQAPAVSFDGTNYLVVWQDYRDDGHYPDIYATRVSPEGRALDLAGIALATIGLSIQDPKVAYDGRNFLVVWVRDDTVKAARVTPLGQILDQSGFVVSGSGDSLASPAVASGSGVSVVTWSAKRSAADTRIYAARVSQDGAVLDTAGIEIGATPGTNAHPAVSFGGSSFLIVWDNQGYIPRMQDIVGVRLDAQAQILDSTPISIDTVDGFQLRPELAASDSGWMVVWQDGWDQHWDVSARRVTADGRVADSLDIAVTRAPGNQLFPRIAADSLGYVVTWEDWRGGAGAIFASRLARDGAVLDSTGIVVSSDTTARGTPAVAAADGGLIVWCDARHGTSQSDIYGSRVTLSGGVLDTAGFMISTRPNSQTRPAVAFDGTNFLAVWTDKRRPDLQPSLYGERVAPDGTVLDTAPFVISEGHGSQTCARVAFGGSYYLVVWQDSRSGSQCVYASRVSREGIVMDTAGIGVSPPAKADMPPDVASDGDNFLVVWTDIYVGADGDIRGARVSQAGQVLDPSGITICNAPHWQYQSRVACGDSDYLVVWADERDNHIYTAVVYAARVSRGGVVREPNGIRVASKLTYWNSPDVASDRQDWLLVWSDLDSLGICKARISPSGQVLDSNRVPVSRASYTPPVVRWCVPNYVVLWVDATSVLSGVGINSSGEVTDTFCPTSRLVSKGHVGLAPDTAGNFFVVYSGYTDSIDGHYCGTNRIWGLSAPATEVAEEPVRTVLAGTEIDVAPNPCRGVLYIRARTGAGSSHKVVCVHDAAGRLVRRLGLDAGACATVNLFGLPDGVYFVSLYPYAAVRKSQLRSKVTLSR